MHSMGNSYTATRDFEPLQNGSGVGVKLRGKTLILFRTSTSKEMKGIFTPYMIIHMRTLESIPYGHLRHVFSPSTHGSKIISSSLPVEEIVRSSQKHFYSCFFCEYKVDAHHLIT